MLHLQVYCKILFLVVGIGYHEDVILCLIIVMVLMGIGRKVSEGEIEVMKENHDLGPLCLLQIVNGLLTVTGQ
jgi:hypothetical protein